MANYRNDNSNDSGLGCVVMILLAIIAMPLVGLYLLLAGKDAETKLIGAVMIAIGLILYITTGLA